MRPLRLTLYNFAKYRGEHVIDLGGVSLAVLSGPNGSGKSTLAVQSIRWALWGATPGGADAVINDQEESCRVELTFRLGGETYMVARQRSRKGGGKTLLSFQVLGEDGPVVLDGKGIAETQQRIIETLRLTDELFCMTACVSQGEAAAFSEARPAERKGVLGEILGLDLWETRAEIARRMGRDLDGRIENMGEQITTAKTRAAEADGLRDEIADLNCDIEHAEESISEHERELTEAQEAKANLAREQEADRGRRRELEQLGEQVEAAEAEVVTLGARVTRLQRAAEGAEGARDELEQARAAQARAEELEDLRRRDEALHHEAELLKRTRESMEQAQADARRTLERQAEEAEAGHAREVERLRKRAADLEKRAKPLSEIPCAGAEYEAECPLIELAREARDELPAACEELAAIDGLDPDTPPHPAAEYYERLAAAFMREDAGAAEQARINEIAAERGGLDYNADEYAAAKRQAGRLGELQQRIAEIQAAEGQIAEAGDVLDGAKTKAANLSTRRNALIEELGPKRNWDALLSAVESSIGESRTAIATLRSRVQSLGQRRGSLQERLRGAEEAAAEAEELAEDLRTSERRLQVLKALAQAFGKQGIPALLIEQAVPELEETANEVLTTLSDGRMSLELVMQAETKSHSLTETLDIVVAGVEGRRAYGTFSGGERMRVDLAVRIGLSALLAGRAGAQIDMLVLDETCAPLDEQGQDLFVECLGRLTEYFGLILCITHVPRLKDVFPAQLAISRDGNGSRVELVGA